jgi:putative aldouronate transport system permease protein
MTILFRIILPLSLPMIVTFALYYAVDRWNEWYNGMLFIRTFDKRPLQLVLRGIIQTTGNQLYTSDLAMYEIQPFSEGIKMACIVVTMTPIILVYPFLQRYFISGLTVGAVKG